MLLEATIFARRLDGRSCSLRCLAAAVAANAVSGVAGVMLSLAANGGWWLVVWVPWVSANEVGAGQLPELVAYLIAAFALSVLLEWPVVALCVRGAGAARVLRTTLFANAVSTVLLGAIIAVLGAYAT